MARIYIAWETSTWTNCGAFEREQDANLACEALTIRATEKDDPGAKYEVRMMTVRESFDDVPPYGIFEEKTQAILDGLLKQASRIASPENE